jgi:hypothetical protein
MAQMLKLKTPCKTTDAPWDPDQTLADALAERELFLESHPRHKGFQDQIDRMMDQSGNAQARMTVLAILMEAKLIELHSQLKRLNKILIKAAG